MSTPQAGGNRRPALPESGRAAGAPARPGGSGAAQPGASGESGGSARPARSGAGKSGVGRTGGGRTGGGRDGGGRSAAGKGVGGNGSGGGKDSAAGKGNSAGKGNGAGRGGGAGRANGAGKRAGAGKASGAGRGGGKGGPRGRAGGGGRPPGRPIRVAAGRNWFPVILFSTVALIAAGIVGFALYEANKGTQTWQQKADAIRGVVDYRKKDPQSLQYTEHTTNAVKYKYLPPVGGTHNPNWQRCLGDVYDAPIANENAVHSEEHGAIWITYRPDLPADQVNALAAKVRGNDFMLMSPYPDLDRPISLQAWGFQLKVDNASDPRIDEFIRDLRQNASMESGAVCSSGNVVTATGTTPHNADSGAAPATGMTP